MIRTFIAATALVGAIALVGLTTQPAHAALMDGKTLLAACTQETGSPRRSICLGYIAAIADALGDAGVGKRKACVGSAKLSAMRDAVVQHLTAQKSTADKPASEGVTIALANRFKC